MDLSNSPSHADPVYRKLHRAFFAVCLLLAPLTLCLWFGLCPTEAGDPACPDYPSYTGALVAFRAANPLLLQVFLREQMGNETQDVFPQIEIMPFATLVDEPCLIKTWGTYVCTRPLRVKP